MVRNINDRKQAESSTQSVHTRVHLSHGFWWTAHWWIPRNHIAELGPRRLVNRRRITGHLQHQQALATNKSYRLLLNVPVVPIRNKLVYKIRSLFDGTLGILWWRVHVSDACLAYLSAHSTFKLDTASR